MISRDKDALTGKQALSRHVFYARIFGELDVIAFTTKGQEVKKKETLSVYPTNSRSKLFFMLDAWRLASALSRPDVITVQDPFDTGLVGLILAKRWNVPLHVQVHTDFMDVRFIRHTPLNLLRRLCALYIIRRAARIRAVSHRIKESLSDLTFPTPISVLPIFIDVSQFSIIKRTQHPRFSPSLIVAGRFEKEKQFDLALKSLKALLSTVPSAGLTLVGEGSEEQFLRHLVYTLGINEKVVFSGWQQDLRPFYAQADLLLVTSAYEGYGGVILEALASGVPVLSTDVGIAREAGAIVVSQETLPEALIDWVATGPRKGYLQNYPYESFEQYVRMICRDIADSVQVKKVI